MQGLLFTQGSLYPWFPYPLRRHKNPPQKQEARLYQEVNMAFLGPPQTSIGSPFTNVRVQKCLLPSDFLNGYEATLWVVLLCLFFRTPQHLQALSKNNQVIAIFWVSVNLQQCHKKDENRGKLRLICLLFPVFILLQWLLRSGQQRLRLQCFNCYLPPVEGIHLLLQLSSLLLYLLLFFLMDPFEMLKFFMQLAGK